MSSRGGVGRFHFLRELGSGGFGSVFLAKVEHADGFSRLVAVKILKNQWTDSKEIASRMRDEARLLGLLRHRNIVDVLDSGSSLDYIEPGDPSASYLWLKMNNTQSTVPGGSGNVMPPSGMLSSADLLTVEEWITGGALEN